MDRLSTLQYNMLRLFTEAQPDFHMTLEAAARYDQRPFRSMLIRKWIAYRAGRGFHITAEGTAAWKDFQSHSIMRRNPYGPLTSYFDATAYKSPRKLKVVA